jgi:hypothetical protein
MAEVQERTPSPYGYREAHHRCTSLLSLLWLFFHNYRNDIAEDLPAPYPTDGTKWRSVISRGHDPGPGYPREKEQLISIAMSSPPRALNHQRFLRMGQTIPLVFSITTEDRSELTAKAMDS